MAISLIQRINRLPGQLKGRHPFSGTLVVDRLPIATMTRLTARKLRTPLDILDYAFRGENDLKYLDVPGFPPILFVRDPEIIKAVTLGTANNGDFDRDTLQTQGIARVLGGWNLLFSQGEIWKRHRMAAARVFGATNFQNPDIYSHMEQTIRRAVEPQIEQLANQVRQSPTGTVEMRLESGIQAMMLNVLVNVMFGSQVPFDELRDRYLPAIATVIRYIMLDTVVNQARLPVLRLPSLSRRHAYIKQQRLIFEELVERVIQTRSEGAGFWPLMTAEGPEEAIRSNVRVFLAGALEATTSYIGWALSNLARNDQARAKAQTEADTAEISPVGREKSTYLQKVLAETLRLNNTLFFLPRIAIRNTTLTNTKGTLSIPEGTHILLGTYHAGRCEKLWGVSSTGFPAVQFVPERWEEENLAKHGRTTKDAMHFGFGHGPRVCIGKHFSEAEAFVCLTLFLRRFEFTAVQQELIAKSGVSTSPGDSVNLRLSLRFY